MSTEDDPMDVFFALAFQKTLLDLAKRDNSDWYEAIRRITKSAADALKCGRVSVWLYDESRSEIVCECLYQISTDDYEKGIRLQAKDYPRYFQAMEENRTVAANDAQTDLRTSEFSEGYLKPQDITSMMDVPVRLHGKVIGVVCHEHTGLMRNWTRSDQEFAASIADLTALSFESARRKRAEEKLTQLNRELEEKLALLERIGKTASGRGKTKRSKKK